MKLSKSIFNTNNVKLENPLHTTNDKCLSESHFNNSIDIINNFLINDSLEKKSP